MTPVHVKFILYWYACLCLYVSLVFISDTRMPNIWKHPNLCGKDNEFCWSVCPGKTFICCLVRRQMLLRRAYIGTDVDELCGVESFWEANRFYWQSMTSSFLPFAKDIQLTVACSECLHRACKWNISARQQWPGHLLAWLRFFVFLSFSMIVP